MALASIYGTNELKPITEWQKKMYCEYVEEQMKAHQEYWRNIKNR